MKTIKIESHVEIANYLSSLLAIFIILQIKWFIFICYSDAYLSLHTLNSINDLIRINIYTFTKIHIKMKKGYMYNNEAVLLLAGL